jgi:hypothetical protein
MRTILNILMRLMVVLPINVLFCNGKFVATERGSSSDWFVEDGKQFLCTNFEFPIFLRFGHNGPECSQLHKFRLFLRPGWLLIPLGFASSPSHHLFHVPFSC